jgi:antitoxin MazE
MNHYVRKWGNSAAVRLPASALAATGLKPNDPVTVREEDGRIVIEPVHHAVHDIEALIEAITPENRHEETDWGPPAGKEIW